MSAIGSAKLQLRKSMRQRLLQLSAEQLACSSQQIQAHVVAHQSFRRAQHVSIYLSMDTCEAQTFALAEHALAAGKSLYVPRCRGPRMDMVRVADTAALAGLTRNAWGIAEPSDDDPAVDPKILDFVLVPGLAFDVNGNRCGHGRGYYDRYLAMLSPDAVTCAICLTEQITDHVPTNEHDIKPHMLITPEGIQYSSKD